MASEVADGVDVALAGAELAGLEATGIDEELACGVVWGWLLDEALGLAGTDGSALDDGLGAGTSGPPEDGWQPATASTTQETTGITSRAL
ncbi:MULTISPECIES: hypothetical protein [unclassified Luteococcus]|uniref:hypothetical protein n=1 Tax=unclassified Luteococcus TaxID=2639923 RepID=UPI00313F29A5